VKENGKRGVAKSRCRSCPLLRTFLPSAGRSSYNSGGVASLFVLREERCARSVDVL
jgi:hypothetical protein